MEDNADLFLKVDLKQNKKHSPSEYLHWKKNHEILTGRQNTSSSVDLRFLMEFSWERWEVWRKAVEDRVRGSETAVIQDLKHITQS